MKYLPLTFAGVLQHYTSDDFTSMKGTFNCAYHPTKTAVIGLIASAMGIERGSPELDRLYNTITVKYRTEKQGSIITDFQTVRPLKSQSYFLEQFRRDYFLNLAGKKLTNNQLRKVQYLQDAEFTVYIGADEETLKTIFDAICNPVYALYLGKRSCVPNKPIVTNFELVEELENVYDCA